MQHLKKSRALIMTLWSLFCNISSRVCFSCTLQYHYPFFHADKLLGMFIRYAYTWSRYSVLTVGSLDLANQLEITHVDISAIVYEHYIMCCT